MEEGLRKKYRKKAIKYIKKKNKNYDSRSYMFSSFYPNRSFDLKKSALISLSRSRKESITNYTSSDKKTSFLINKLELYLMGLIIDDERLITYKGHTFTYKIKDKWR